MPKNHQDIRPPVSNRDTESPGAEQIHLRLCPADAMALRRLAEDRGQTLFGCSSIPGEEGNPQFGSTIGDVASTRHHT